MPSSGVIQGWLQLSNSLQVGRRGKKVGTVPLRCDISSGDELVFSLTVKQIYDSDTDDC